MVEEAVLPGFDEIKSRQNRLFYHELASWNTSMA